MRNVFCKLQDVFIPVDLIEAPALISFPTATKGPAMATATKAPKSAEKKPGTQQHDITPSDYC